MGQRGIRWLGIIVTLALATSAWADPIKIHPVEVTASSSFSGDVPGNACDGNSATVWNAGRFATQWIQFDLGRTVSLRRIRLQIAQSPTGDTRHIVSVGQSPTSLHQATEFVGTTHDGQWLEFDLGGKELGNVRYIRVTTDKSPSWIAWREAEFYQGMEYMGWYADNFEAADYTAQTTAAGANLVWIRQGTPAEYAPRLQEAAQHHAKAVVVLELLSNQDTGLPWPNWTQTWSELVSVIHAAPPDEVAAFVIHDEPYGWGYTQQTLAMMANYVRKDFPSIPILVILDAQSIDQNVGPAAISMFDWVGFDCYGPWTHCWGNHDMDAMIAKVRSWLTPQQRMVAVPWADATATDTASQNEVVSVLNHWHREILSDGKYVAIMPFIWQHLDSSFGTSQLPWVKDRLTELSRSMFPQPTDTIVYPVDETASLTGSNSGPFAAFDLADGSVWNSGAYAPQWIEADFGGSVRIGRIYFTVEQLPPGNTTHLIQGLTPSGWVNLGTLSRYTQAGQTFEWDGYQLFDVSRIRITTTASPSWVAWRNISFSRALLRRPTN